MPGLKIGSDPEFLVFKKGDSQPVNAEKLFPQCYAQLGVDGGGFLGEMRPTASIAPQGHLKAILGLMTKFKAKYPNYEMRVLTGHEAIGGHIHFSGPKAEWSGPKARLLDKYLAMPFALLVPPNVLSRRLNSGYGRLSNTKSENHGGWEYRTITSWLCNYATAKMVLEVAYLIVHDSDHLHEEKPYRDLSQQCLNSHRQRVRTEALNHVSELKALPNAAEVMPSIELLAKMISTKQTLHESENCADSWVKASRCITDLKYQSFNSKAKPPEIT